MLTIKQYLFPGRLHKRNLPFFSPLGWGNFKSTFYSFQNDLMAAPSASKPID